MRRARQPRQATLRRRAKILNAALHCFTHQGVAATTIGEIRQQSRASTGSIYHQFSSKEEIAAALYVQTVRAYHDGLLAKVARVHSAERGIRAMVEYHVDWVVKNVDRARFLATAEHPHSNTPEGREHAHANQHFLETIFAWATQHMRAGALRRLHRETFVALVLGPADTFTRHWLEHRRKAELTGARHALADGAWAAVRKRR
jgi:AcrR family transcriptional regulator